MMTWMSDIKERKKRRGNLIKYGDLVETFHFCLYNGDKR